MESTVATFNPLVEGLLLLAIGFAFATIVALILALVLLTL